MKAVKEEVLLEIVGFAHEEKYKNEIDALRRRNELLEQIKPLESR